MRKIFIFSIAFMLIAGLYIGCGDDDDDDIAGPGGPGGAGGSGMGYFSMNPGDWSELRSPDGDRDISKFIGDDTWQGRACIVLEFESYSNGQQGIDQIWMDKTTGEVVVIIMKANGELTRMDPTTFPSGTTDDTTPWEMPDVQNLGTEKYTTPTGKTVTATKYQYNVTTPIGVTNDESWVSSEVPFDVVKNFTNGRELSSLYDFGTGATRLISKQEAESATPFEMPTIPGGGDPFDPNDPGNGGGDPFDPGNGGGDPINPGNPQQEGEIIITIGAGARPTISVSQPIMVLTIIGENDVTWGFSSPAAQVGPFQYGVIPAGAVLLGAPNLPDMQAGQTYIVQVIGMQQGLIPPMGSLTFVR